MRDGAANLRFLIDVAAISILEFRMQNRYWRPVIARAFSSEVDPVRVKKTPQNKNLELRF
jgi:hypothetical protein